MSAFYEQRPEKLFIGGMTRYPFPTHVHTMAELTVLTHGSAQVTVDDTQYRLSPGDGFVVFPLTPHSYDALSEDAAGVTAIFPPDIIPEYAATFHTRRPESPFLPAASAGQDLRLAVNRLSRMDMRDRLPLCVAYLHVVLAEVLGSLTCRPAYDYSEKDLGRRIIRYISQHAFEQITLESASRALGVSVSHLSHFFSERMHVSFRRYINALRVSRASLLMRDPTLTLTDISGACGYTNMRTFRRAFQAEMGCLPSEQQEAQRQAQPAPPAPWPEAFWPGE